MTGPCFGCRAHDIATEVLYPRQVIFPSITATVGRTPLVEFSRIARGCQARLLAKIESRNPCSSVKDRVGVALIEDAERRGALRPGATLIEPTSGNTGIALAFAAAAKGYKLVITMPEQAAKERIALLRHMGSEVVLTPGTLMSAAVRRAEEILAQTPGAVMLQQFKNPANPEVHRRTTAVEIWDDTGGAVDVFVAGVGTGGTITGVGEVLKARRPSVRIVAVEPAASAVLSGRPPGHHLITGLGAGFIPEVLNRAIIDEIIPVEDQDAFSHARILAREEGISAGVSSGAALSAALAVARRPEMANKTIVVVLPDAGERYLSHPAFEEVLQPVRQ